MKPITRDRESPTAEEERAVLRAAVKWATTAVEHYTPRDRPMPPKHAAIVTAVDRLLAKRKARR